MHHAAVVICQSSASDGQSRLAAQAQSLDQFAILQRVFFGDVLQMAATLADQLQQTTAGMFIMRVDAQVVC